MDQIHAARCHCAGKDNCPLAQLPESFFISPQGGKVNVEFVSINDKLYLSVEMCIHCWSCYHRSKECTSGISSEKEKNVETNSKKKEFVKPRRTVLKFTGH